MNKIDPMVIVPQWRDSRPKTDLSGGFIGDRYPLCSDLPFKMFLRKGAKYQLLGGSILPHFHKELELDVDGASDTILELDPTASSLHKALCNPLENGECTYPNEVVLEKALDCAGMECLIDAARMVELAGGVVFEYVPPPCVELTFFGEGRVARSRKGEVDVCADPRLPVAGSACCPADSDRARWECIFTGELFTHQSASNRCVSEGEEVCSFSKVPSSSCDECCVEDAFLWTDDDCRLQIKVSRSGHVALVHNTADLYGESSNRNPSHLSLETTEYFRVFWANSRYPSIDDGCNEAGVSSFCRPLNEDECLCDIAVAEEEVFSSGMPTKEQVLHDLFIGHVDPSNYGNGTYFEEKENDVIAYHSLSAGPGIGPSSVFLAEDEVEGKLFLKNTMSSVRVGESLGSLSFRNPPKFMSSFDPQPKDAMYETDVVLESYIKHHNTAPFIATRLIQRFGMSNPSPRFVQTVATAFKTGTYTFTSPRNQQSIVFGDSRLGSIGAAVAAIILDRESRAVVLDADPSHGALKEPVLSLLGFMRSMRYQANKGHELVKLHGVQDRIGQMAFESPTVFSFMLPHYSPLGPVADALLVAPEAQLMAMSSVVASMNAVFSLINFGLTSCDYGLGGRPTQGCSRLYEGDYSRSQGRLKYKPAAATAEEIVDELATLLNSGRLSDQSRDIIIDMYGRLSDKEAALRMAQKLIVATPEYATTSATPQSVGLERKAANVATTCRPYKAVVVIMLEGACDSQNMLVPHSGCEDRIGKDLYAEYATVRNYLAIDKDDLLPIESNNTAQPCSSFGLHPLLKGLHALYSEESALFLANIGMLPKSFSRASHVRGLKMNLYSHEHMQSEVKKVDAYRNFSGTGVLGRLADVMSRSGLRTGSVALDEVSEASTGRITRPMVVNEKNVENFAPMPTSGLFKAAVRRLNDATSFRSSMMGETWSRIITDSMSENALIYNTLQDFETSIDFSKDSISRQLETVARLISTRRCRGVEREVFYVKSGGWDTHDNMKKRLDENFQELDESITSFVKEMKYQGMFKDVVMMMHSDFGRTLTPNSRGGSDHGWGGNSFVLGGAVKGGRIFGEYPSDLTDGGYLNLGRGRVLPTMSYESIWNAISLWFGVKESDLSEVLPNRRSFVGNLFTQEDIFESNHDENSTQPEEKACSVEHLEKTCMFDAGGDSWTPYGRARKYGGYGNSGITNMAAFLLLIVGLFLLCGVATCCWRRSAEKRRQDVSAGDVIL